MLYLILPQLPIALAFAMGGRRDKEKTEDTSQSPDELTAPPPNPDDTAYDEKGRTS
jgi:hypothetical protein